jgi:lysyl-tRNA synthetase class 2
MATRLETIRKLRLEKLKRLRELGIEPYPAQSRKDYSNKEVVDNFPILEGKTVNLAGRVMTWREHGKVIFTDITDESGKLQLVLKQDVLSPTDSKRQTIGFGDLELLDGGDFVAAEGEIIKTKTGEISILVKNLRLLSKALRPLPEKWEGLKDREIIFRRRYLDLTMNSGRREMFRRKAKFWEVQRRFMKDHGFMEVETPVLEQVTGGADARPFVTHMNALDQDFYLRISTELYQKRLIGGGFEKIYTLGPNFRNEGIDDEHLPEYYQLEWYWAYADYRDNMKLVREMFRYIGGEVYGKTKFAKGGRTFDLSDEWEEIDYRQAIRDKLGIDVFGDGDKKMLEVITKAGVSLAGKVDRNRIIDNLWKIVRKDITGPAFLVNVPKFISPLAKSKKETPEMTERFQVIIAGSELGNGYSELNDPVDQMERFKQQQAAREAGDEEAQMMDIDFVEMLEYGMPPTSGYGHSERIFWTLEGVSGREATLFPQLKRADPRLGSRK